MNFDKAFNSTPSVETKTRDYSFLEDLKDNENAKKVVDILLQIDGVSEQIIERLVKGSVFRKFMERSNPKNLEFLVEESLLNEGNLEELVYDGYDDEWGLCGVSFADLMEDGKPEILKLAIDQDLFEVNDECFYYLVSGDLVNLKLLIEKGWSTPDLFESSFSELILEYHNSENVKLLIKGGLLNEDNFRRLLLSDYNNDFDNEEFIKFISISNPENLKLFIEKYLLNESNFEELVNDENFRSLMKDGNPENLKLLIERSWLDEDNLVELVKNKTFGYLMQRGEPENLQFFADKSWLNKDNFVELFTNENFALFIVGSILGKTKLRDFELFVNEGLLNKSNFVELAKNENFRSLTRLDRPENLEFFVQKDFLSEGRLVKIVKDDKFLQFLKYFELTKPENPRLLADKGWLNKDNFVDLVKDGNFRSLMKDAEPEKLKKYIENDLITLKQKFFLENYKTLAKLEDETVFNADDENQTASIKKLLEKNNETLTPAVTKKWLEAGTEEEKESILKKIKELKNFVLKNEKSQDLEIDYKDEVTIEILSAIYTVPLDFTQGLMRKLHKELEDKSNKNAHEKNQKALDRIKTPTYQETINLAIKEYGKVSKNIQELDTFTREGVSQEWLQNSLQASEGVGQIQKEIIELQDKINKVETATEKEELQSELKSKSEIIKNSKDVLNQLPTRFISFILSHTEDTRIDDYQEDYENQPEVGKKDIQRIEELHEMLFDAVGDETFKNSLQGYFSKQEKLLEGEELELQENLKKTINSYLQFGFRTSLKSVGSETIAQTLDNLQKETNIDSAIDILKNSNLQNLITAIGLNNKGKKESDTKLVNLKAHLVLNKAKKTIENGSKEIDYPEVMEAMIALHQNNFLNDVFNKQNDSTNIKKTSSEDDVKITYTVRKKPFDMLAWKACDLCIKEETGDFLEARCLPVTMFVDGKVVGSIILYLSLNDDANIADNKYQDCLFVDGFNPTNEFLSQIPSEKMAQQMASVVTKIAKELGKKAIYIPNNRWDISNRNSFVKYITNIQAKTQKNNKSTIMPNDLEEELTSYTLAQNKKNTPTLLAFVQ